MKVRSLVSRLSLRRLAPALAVCVAAWLPATPAKAGFVVSFPPPIPVDSNYPYFFTGPFVFDPTVPVSGSGVLSNARYRESLFSNLPTGPFGTQEVLNLNADSGLIVSTEPGTQVKAQANVGPTNNWIGANGPAQARTKLFKNHVYADTDIKFTYTNSRTVYVQGQEYAAGEIVERSGNVAAAGSAWYDGWRAEATGTVDVTMELEGFVEYRTCSVPSCGRGYPLFTDSFVRSAPAIVFSATLVVYDQDNVAPCGPFTNDWCGQPYAWPVGIIEVRYQADATDEFPLSLDRDVTVSFQAQAGRRYLAIGAVTMASVDGGTLDFYNTVGLRVNAPAGTLFSAGLGGADLGAHFATPVPEPATWGLWAAGLLGVWGRARHARRIRRFV